MKKNMGLADRLIRVLVAITIAACYFTHIINGLTAIILLVIAGVFLLTSLISFCPIWLALGIQTNKKTN